MILLLTKIVSGRCAFRISDFCYFGKKLLVEPKKAARCNPWLQRAAFIPYFKCQIVSLYSRMVRSEEKMPEQAVLVMAMRSHFSRF